MGRLTKALAEKMEGAPKCVQTARSVAGEVEGGQGQEGISLLAKAARQILSEAAAATGQRNPGDGGEEECLRKKYGHPLWIRAHEAAWGPVGWKLVRKWICFGLLDEDVFVSSDGGEKWQKASSIEKFSRITSELFHRRGWVFNIMSKLEPTPPSRALITRLTELGWPGAVERLGHYYIGNLLREDLEKFLPCPRRSPFADPEWPAWMNTVSPAEAGAIEERGRNRPATREQLEVLDFFLGEKHGITKFGEAHDKISELFSDEEKHSRWTTRNDHKPPTQPQLERLQWWARRIGETLPRDLTFGYARTTLDKWERGWPDLLEKWREYQNKVEEQESIFLILQERIQEECQDAGLPAPNEKELRLCWDLIGRDQWESGMDMLEMRLGRELELRHPEYTDLHQWAIWARREKRDGRDG